MSPTELQFLFEQYGQPFELQRHQRIGQAGHVITDLFWVHTGSLGLYWTTPQADHMVRLVYADNFFAFLDVFMGMPTSDLLAVAFKKVQGLRMPKKYWEDWCSTPSGAFWWQQFQAQLLLQQLEREKDLLTSSPLLRYQRLMQRSPHVFQHIPAQYIAEYLQMTPETLSRVRKLDLNQEERR